MVITAVAARRISCRSELGESVKPAAVVFFTNADLENRVNINHASAEHTTNGFFNSESSAEN